MSEQSADWLIGTFKRNPEALLVLAAGCALLMRSKGSAAEAPRHEGQYYRDAELPPWQQQGGPSGQMNRAAQDARDYATDTAARVADTAGKYADTASEYAGKVSDAASGYAASAADYAGQVRDKVASGVSQFPGQARSTVEQGFARVLREQPLAIAAMGLAAGATLAAIFPSTEAESHVLGPAHDAVVGAASRAAENVKAAAGEVGEQLKQAARDRGLDPDGLKDLARDVAGNFADNVARGSSDQNAGQPRSDAPGLVPEHTGTGT
jgi:hypothetical protein